MPSFERRSGKTHSLEGGPDDYLSRSQPVQARRLVWDAQLDGVPVEEVVGAPFDWQPGWEYELIRGHGA